MNRNIGCCGIDCAKCDAYIATKNNDEELRKATAELWSKLNGAEIKPEHIHCEGCRLDGCKTYYCSSMCEVRKCVASKGYATCGECADVDSCAKVAPYFAGNAEARDNLRIREKH